MRDRIGPALDEYARMRKRQPEAYAFYASDFVEIMNRSRHDFDISGIVFKSLNAGFVIGYRTAKREARKKHAEN